MLGSVLKWSNDPLRTVVVAVVIMFPHPGRQKLLVKRNLLPRGDSLSPFKETEF